MFIPILSILQILSTSIGAIVAYEGYKRWKRSKLLLMEYFYKAVFWHTMDCVAIMVMPFFSFNLYFIQLLWNLNIFAGTIYYANLLAFLLLFLGVEKLHRIVKNLLITIAPLNLIFGILFLKPATISTYHLPFGNLKGIIWRASLPLIFNILTGVGITILFVVFIPLLTKKIFSLENSLERQKGIYLILGIAGLFLAAILNWFVSPISGYSFWKDLIQGLLCSPGQIFFGLGMLLRKR